MKLFLAVIIAVLLLIATSIVQQAFTESWEQKARADAWHHQQSRMLEIEQARLQATAEAERLQRSLAAERQREELAQQARPALSATWTGVQIILLCSLALLAVGAVVGAGAWAWRRRRIVWPDSYGRLPVPVGILEAEAPRALAMYHNTEFARAGIGPVPTSYAPHYTIHPARNDPAQLLPGDVAPALPAPTTAPSFAELLAAGSIGPGNPLTLGYRADGSAVYGTWLDLYSTGIGGLTGSGKTWTGVNLLAQSVLHGAGVLCIDPHGHDAESLTGRLAPLHRAMLADPAISQRDMQALISLVQDELQRRLQRGKGQPWVLAIDEYTALQRSSLAEPLAQLLEALAQEGRKLGLYALALGQNWTGRRSGGTEVRDSLASAYVHRLRPAQARYLTGLTADELPRDLLELPPGTAYLLSTGGDLSRVMIPKMQAADVVAVADVLASGQADTGSAGRCFGFRPATTRQPGGNQMEVSTEQDSSAPASAEAARVLALFRQGFSVAQIVKELYGEGAGTGRRYQRASEEVQELLRQALASA